MRAAAGTDRLGFPSGPVPKTGPYVMSGVELATSLVRGTDPGTAPLSRARGTNAASVRAALEHALLPALERAPCLVAFSGGLDSSAVLAAATSAARAHGLPLPIPATNRFPGDRGTDESEWQQMVVSHLGVRDWVRLDITDELDLVGPYATIGLLRHGVLWPPNAHFLAPLAGQAVGGTLLTGIGGDELFTPSVPRGTWVLAGRATLRRTDLIEVARVLAPARLKQRAVRRRVEAPEWLTAVGLRLWIEGLARDASKEPLWWGRSVIEDWWTSRSRIGVVASVGSVAGDATQVVNPFMAPAFVSAVADARWKTGFRRRSEAIELICGDTLPAALRERTDKAAFFAPFVSRYSRSFISVWDGSGIDAELVDAEALRRAWQADLVDARSYVALQAAWLASHHAAAAAERHAAG
jgi:hypothetical protein